MCGCALLFGHCNSKLTASTILWPWKYPFQPLLSSCGNGLVLSALVPAENNDNIAHACMPMRGCYNRVHQCVTIQPTFRVWFLSPSSPQSPPPFLPSRPFGSGARGAGGGTRARARTCPHIARDVWDVDAVPAAKVWVLVRVHQHRPRLLDGRWRANGRAKTA